MSTGIDTKQEKKKWLDRLSQLMEDVSTWAKALGWSTRQIDKTLEDSVVGEHKVPVLMLQKETTRILLEPIARQTPGAEGVVDLYLLPAYDDIASLYYETNGWKLHYMFPSQPTVGDIRQAEPLPFSQQSFEKVVEEMAKNAV
jgi:hypothetical protein